MRESKENYFIKIADLISSQSTCYRRKVGCVLVDNNYHILSTGYNGVPSSFDHCLDNKVCVHAKLSKSGTNLDNCLAVHAEQNALLQCSNVQTISACFTTTSPCITCLKLLLNTSCQTIYFKELYSSNYKDLWLSAHRNWVQL